MTLIFTGAYADHSLNANIRPQCSERCDAVNRSLKRGQARIKAQLKKNVCEADAVFVAWDCYCVAHNMDPSLTSP